MDAEKAKMAGSARWRARCARRGVRCSGCHGWERVRVQRVTATTSRARVRAKRVKSTVLPASGGGVVGGRWCWFGES
jgi:hypothetical protein